MATFNKAMRRGIPKMPEGCGGLQKLTSRFGLTEQAQNVFASSGDWQPAQIANGNQSNSLAEEFGRYACLAGTRTSSSNPARRRFALEDPRTGIRKKQRQF